MLWKVYLWALKNIFPDLKKDLSEWVEDRGWDLPLPGKLAHGSPHPHSQSVQIAAATNLLLGIPILGFFSCELEGKMS